MYRIVLCLLFFTDIVCEEKESIKQTDGKTILGLYQLMKDVDEVFTAKQITYWIDSGTLLGAVRHKGIIPWDNDIDICIDIKDQDLLLKQVPLFEKLDITFHKYNWGWKLLSKEGLELDVFFTMKVDDKIIYWSHYIQVWYATRDGGPVYYTPDELFPLKEYHFGELSVMGPNNPFPYLDAYYKNWQTSARILLDHVENIWDPRTIMLTDEHKVPGVPTGPLEHRTSLALTATEG